MARSPFSMVVTTLALLVADGAHAAGKPVAAVMLSGDQASVEKARAVVAAAGYQLLDITGRDEPFAAMSPLSLGVIDTPRPADWPAELNAVWDRGAAACRSRAGDPPYNMRNKGAFMCGRQLAAALWQRYLDHLAPQLVVRVFAGEIDKKNCPRCVEVAVTAYGPADTSERALSRQGLLWAEAPGVVEGFVRRVVSGDGERHTRAVARDLPEAPDSKAVLAGEVLDLPAIAIPADCKRPLPANLRIAAGDGGLAGTISRRWRRTVEQRPAPGPDVVCELTVSNQGEVMPGMGTGMISFVYELRCGDQTFTSTTPGFSATHRASQTRASERLLRDFAAAACR